VDDLEGVLAQFAINPKFIDTFQDWPPAVLNTDDRTLLEYGFAKTVGKAIHFSLDVLRQETEASDRLPPLDVENVDWDLVERRRLEFNLIGDGDLIAPEYLKPAEKALATAFSLLRSGRNREAIEAWPREEGRRMSGIELLALGKAYAELGQPNCLPLLAEAENRFPVEAVYIRAIYHLRRKEAKEAADALEEFYLKLKDEPFAMRFFIGSVLETTLEIGSYNREMARRFFDIVAQPLPAYRYEQKRPFLRVLLAALLGEKEFADVLREYEPNIFWFPDILARRAEVYSKLKDPRAAEAERDWRRFEDHKR
jgi:hypothetical protein